MSIMLAVDILGCTGSAEERAALLHKTIQLAAELRGTMGNMFSFAAVMGALDMAQVVRGPCRAGHPIDCLEEPWDIFLWDGCALVQEELCDFLCSAGDRAAGRAELSERGAVLRATLSSSLGLSFPTCKMNKEQYRSIKYTYKTAIIL